MKIDKIWLNMFLGFIGIYVSVILIYWAINSCIASYSLIGNKVMYPPDLLSESSYLISNFSTIRREAELYKHYKPIKGDLFFTDIVESKKDWLKLYIKWFSDITIEARTFCPKTSALIESLPRVKTAMFSVLKPHTRIFPHRGPFKGCIRFHLGLTTPNSPDCYIVVDGNKYFWKDGEGILFDDTYVHYVVNDTDEERTILFCDIVRPCFGFGKQLNDFIINYIAPLTSRGN